MAGLLSLREGFAFDLLAPASVLAALAANPMFDVLHPARVRRIPLVPGASHIGPSGLQFHAFPVAGKIALHADVGARGQIADDSDTIGLEVSDPATGASFFHIPCCAAVDRMLAERLRGARLVLFDGTLYRDDEMIQQGLSEKSGHRMGHISISGPDGAIAALDDLGIARRIFVHINNSNPVLNEGSAERRATRTSRLGGRFRRHGDATVSAGMGAAELEAAIRAVGAERYHDKHPFHHLLHGGKLQRGQVQAWALNRYCYQAAIPRKDAALLSRAFDRDLRREWVKRVLDHDGFNAEEGGIERWLVLTDALGLSRDLVVSMRAVLPATRFAVEAYVRFVREEALLVAVASSLTELFAPTIHRERIAGMLEGYDFIGEQAMRYFRRRLDQADSDADFALDYVKTHARTRQEQEACIEAVRFKCNVLWAQLDALHHAYVDPGLIPPGAFRPEDA